MWLLYTNGATVLNCTSVHKKFQNSSCNDRHLIEETNFQGTSTLMIKYSYNIFKTATLQYRVKAIPDQIIKKSVWSTKELYTCVHP